MSTPSRRFLPLCFLAGLVAGCAAPSLESKTPTALTAPPPDTQQVATTPLPPVSAPSSSAPAPAPSPDVAAAEPAPDEASAEPQSLEEEEAQDIATAEPAPREIPEGDVDASYSPTGIEIATGDGSSCAGEQPKGTAGIKPGMVFRIACSDDRTGSVRVDKMDGAERALASLKIGTSSPQQITVNVSP